MAPFNYFNRKMDKMEESAQRHRNKFPRFAQFARFYYKLSLYFVYSVVVLGSLLSLAIVYILSRFYKDKSDFFWYLYHSNSRSDYFLMNVLRLAVLKAVFENPILFASKLAHQDPSSAGITERSDRVAVAGHPEAVHIVLHPRSAQKPVEIFGSDQQEQ